MRPGEDGAASPERIGIYLGSALGGIAYAEEQHERYMAKGIRQVAPNLALAVFGGAAPANLGIALDVRGPILSTANSCASGAVAIGEALGAIRAGEIDAAIAGGVEIPLSSLAFGAFDIIRALSSGSNDDPSHACRPFDARRDGFVMGEGAALLVLESDEVVRRPRRRALRRGHGLRRDLGRLSHGPAAGRRPGGGPSGDDRPRRRRASRPRRSTTSAPTRRRPRSATSRRLERSRWRSASEPSSVPVSGTKALYGHPLGASGAIEAAICALAIRDGWAPASVNLSEPDPDIAAILPCLLREGREGEYRRVLSTSFGFGGLNAALVFGAPGLE